VMLFQFVENLSDRQAADAVSGPDRLEMSPPVACGVDRNIAGL
jgi:hypothetical protein